MPFDWMQTEPPATNAEARVAAYLEEVRQRAGLFRRLGHSKAHAIHRCLGNIAWAFSESGTPPITAADVRRVVGEVYDR